MFGCIYVLFFFPFTSLLPMVKQLFTGQSHDVFLIRGGALQLAKMTAGAAG